MDAPIRKRGGLQDPPGGRPKKLPDEKYRQYPLKLPPDVIEWLEENVENKNGFIVEAVRSAIRGRAQQGNAADGYRLDC